ncbi:MAG: Mut7-C RNAse domain-containing protein [Euryarchaeota archaeon]|nr:Mut7-C RNAse domain-containing protein [Euryarchaeota archaeon]
MRILCDEMLGSLARWLRVLGYDTQYARDMADIEIIERAAKEDRVVVTRDRQLAVRLAARAIFITSVDLDSQLDEFLDVAPENPDPSLFLSRCPACNEVLANGRPKEGDVPADVFVSGQATLFCAGCKKYYWEGSHTRNMRAFLARHIHSDGPE